MSDPVLVALSQVEHSLENVVLTNPSPITGITDKITGDLIPFTTGDTLPFTGDESAIQLYKTGSGAINTTTNDVVKVKALLILLYDIPFIGTVGKELAVVITKVKDDLKDLADKIGPAPLGTWNMTTVHDGIDGLQVILNAIQTLPGISGHSADLTKAIDILTKITGLFDDIPSARVELYAIAQQLTVIAAAFDDPTVQ